MSRNSSPSHSRRDSANSLTNSSNPNAFRPRPSGVPSSSGGPGNGSGGGSRLNPSRVPSPAFQTPPGSTTGPIGPARNIGLLLGCPVKLKLVNGPNGGERWVEGQVWCYDPIPGVVVLECPPSEGAGKGRQTFRMVKMNQIRDIQIAEQAAAPTKTSTSAIVAKVLEPIKPINVTAVAGRELAAVKSDDVRRARIGFGVSRWAQEIFDALGKTLPVRWAQTSIVILDDVLLPGPRYRPEDVKTNNEQRMSRVRQVLEGEWARLLKTDEGKAMELEARTAAQATPLRTQAPTSQAT
ncbi:hypothetical protein CROQUDRAFT_54541 [Cronartium quercuum f. sp. fusiforme G11]|uniref:AD domain-containing protein n=1 Tax=Cronartium quercuum f. sp. fusiforme G11 TaxID=708437 RepID=A0A9P6T5H8_9BASI|nr:hypothetical protein CROQUDRAFT_54541 [Cronartium quercuum f. sp. fusiforme G11]